MSANVGWNKSTHRKVFISDNPYHTEMPIFIPRQPGPLIYLSRCLVQWISFNSMYIWARYDNQ
jgi:hypothetical protein